MPGRATWVAHDLLNNLLSDLIYPVLQDDLDPRPTYLDLDEDLLRSLGELLPQDAGDPETYVCERVKETLRAGHLGRIFEEHEQRVRSWQGSKARTEDPLSSPPPHLALLAVFSFAAADMGGGDTSSNAYYTHLVARLGLGKSSPQFEQAFREAVVPLWDAVNEWLIDCDGERGLATAYPSGGMPYIGLPISQVLVRAVDRRHLPVLFSQRGLAPGDVIASEDMERILDECIDHAYGRNHFSRSFVAHWQQPGSREVIAEICCRALETWVPGDIDTESVGRRRGALRLILRVAIEPRRRLRHKFGGRLPSGGSVPDLGLPVEVQPGLWLVRDDDLTSDDPDGAGTAVSDLGQALDSRVGLPEQDMRRLPRPLVPFLRDEATNVYVEADGGHVGLRMCFLCRSDLAEEFEQALEEVASRPPSLHRSADMEGLPEGWVLFLDVVLGRSISLERTWSLEIRDVLGWLADVRSRAVLVSGFILPGSYGHCVSSFTPPVISITDSWARPGDRFELEVSRTRTLTTAATGSLYQGGWTGSGTSLDLGDLGLDDGDYELFWTRDEGAARGRTFRFRLRSASSESPDADPRLATVLTAEHGWLATSVPPGEGEIRLSGALLSGQPDGTPVLPEPPPLLGKPRWCGSVSEEATPASPLLEVTDVPRPCHARGAHHLVYESSGRGSLSFTRYSLGVCKYCGARAYSAGSEFWARSEMWRRIRGLWR